MFRSAKESAKASTAIPVLDAAKNHFELFGLPVGFAVDAKLLAERYRHLVNLAQARRFATDPGDVDEDDDTPSLALVEEAYRTLMDPLERAKYLLNLPDARFGDPAATEPVNSGALLMQQMELRETLAEATHRPDFSVAVATVMTQMAEESASLGKELQTLFADPSPRNLNAAREIVRQLEFIAGCRRDVEHHRAELEYQD